MPKVRANNLTINYDQQGSGEPLVLVPYLAADYACDAFQVADYSKQFTCISVDLRGTGESDKPGGVYSTEMFADDVAALMQGLGIQKAHVLGLSLGAAIGMWLAAKYPQRPRYIFGHSLGGAVAIDLASRVGDERGTIVEGTFTSIADVASTMRWGWLPLP